MNPSFFIPDITLSVRRGWLLTLDLYDQAGAPLAISGSDNVRAKVWSTDDATPEIDADLSSLTSVVTVDNLGTPSTTPARVTVEFHEDDTATLDAATAYTFELHLVDNSDGDKAKPICRANVVVLGTATGDTGP